MRLLLTLPFTDELTTHDRIASWAVLRERIMREVRYREHVRDDAIVEEVSFLDVVPARDAGDVCHVCGRVVTWTEHLPAKFAGGPVRCFANVRGIMSAASQRQLGPGVRREGGALVYSAEFLNDPEAV